MIKIDLFKNIGKKMFLNEISKLTSPEHAWGKLRVFARGCAFALLLSACSSNVELVSGVSEIEANEILSVLIDSGIPVEKVPGKENTASVRIGAEKVGKALGLLRSRGLPREQYEGMGQVFRKDGLISSPLEERARYIYALSQELSNTLSKVDGVLIARVHVVLPEQPGAGDPGLPATAAVFIKHRQGYNLEVVQPQIRRLVTNSIPGLTADRVSVVFVAAQSNRSAATLFADTQHMATVFGFRVAEESATGLLALVWGLVAALVVSIGVVIFWRRAGGKPAEVVGGSSKSVTSPSGANSSDDFSMSED